MLLAVAGRLARAESGVIIFPLLPCPSAPLLPYLFSMPHTQTLFTLDFCPLFLLATPNNRDGEVKLTTLIFAN